MFKLSSASVNRTYRLNPTDAGRMTNVEERLLLESRRREGDGMSSKQVPSVRQAKRTFDSPSPAGHPAMEYLLLLAILLSPGEKTPPTPIDVPPDSHVEMTWQVFRGEQNELYLTLLNSIAKDGLDITSKHWNRQLR